MKYVEFGGGLGDIINQMFRYDTYPYLDTIKDRHVILIITHNPFSREIFELHRNSSLFDIRQVGWVPNDVACKIRDELKGSGIEPVRRLPRMKLDVNIYTSDKDKEILSNIKGRFAVIQPFAGLKNRDIPKDLLDASIMKLKNIGLSVVIIGRNYNRCGQGMREVFDNSDACINLIDMLTVPGTIELIKRCSIFVGTHSSMNIAAWHYGKPTIVMYDEATRVAHFTRKDEWSFGKDFINTSHGTFEWFSTMKIDSEISKITGWEDVLMKKVFLLGAYGYGNCGDDAIRDVIVGGLKGVQVDVGSPPQKPTDHDAMILGGGGILYDNPVDNLNNYIGAMESFSGKKFVFGVGSQGMSSEGIKRTTKELSKCQYVMMRDSDSAKQFKLPKKVKCEVGSDVVFALEPTPTVADWVGDKPTVCFAMNGFDGSNNDSPCNRLTDVEFTSYKSNIYNTIKAVSERYNVIVLAMSKDDFALADFLGTAADNAKVIKYEPSVGWTPRKILYVVSKCKHMVATRYHAIVFAIKVGVPFTIITSIDKSNMPTKQLRLANEMQENVIDIRNIDTGLVIDSIENAVDQDSYTTGYCMMQSLKIRECLKRLSEEL